MLTMKKKSSPVLTKPLPSPKPVASKPSTKSDSIPKPKTHKPVEPKAVKEAKQKTQTTKAQTRSTQQMQQQTTGVQLSDFTVELETFPTHINILTRYQGHYIHTFSLNNTEYAAWLRSTLKQKYIYVQSKVNPSIFYNNLQMMQLVITSIIQTVDTIMARALQAQRAQQAHQAHQAQIRRRFDENVQLPH